MTLCLRILLLCSLAGCAESTRATDTDFLGEPDFGDEPSFWELDASTSVVDAAPSLVDGPRLPLEPCSGREACSEARDAVIIRKQAIDTHDVEATSDFDMRPWENISTVADGTEAMDDLTGSALSDRMDGKGADDVIHGLAGSDLVYGGEGDDTLYGEENADLLYGGPGNDTLRGGSGADVLFGESGMNTLFGNEDADRLFGGGEAETLFGGQGQDSLLGGHGDDVLSGELDDDLLVGGEGNDILRGGDDDDTYYYRRGDGNDRIEDDLDGKDGVYLRGYGFSDIRRLRVGDDFVILLPDAEITVVGFFAGGASIERIDVSE